MNWRYCFSATANASGWGHAYDRQLDRGFEKSVALFTTLRCDMTRSAEELLKRRLVAGLRWMGADSNRVILHLKPSFLKHTGANSAEDSPPPVSR